MSRAQYEPKARAAAKKYGVDPDIYVRLITQESSWNPAAISPVGARGIAQFMPETAAGYGIDPDDPDQALDAGARYLANSLKTFNGDYRKAIASYNAGAGAVQKHGIDFVLSDKFAKGETKTYVQKILGDKAPRMAPQKSLSPLDKLKRALLAVGGMKPQYKQSVQESNQYGTTDEAGQAAAQIINRFFGDDPAAGARLGEITASVRGLLASGLSAEDIGGVLQSENPGYTPAVERIRKQQTAGLRMSPAAATGPSGKPTAEYIAERLAEGSAFYDEDGKVHVYDPSIGKEITFVETDDGDFVLSRDAEDEKLTAQDKARLGFDYATLEQRTREFDAEFGRGIYEDDRDYETSRMVDERDFDESVTRDRRDYGESRFRDRRDYDRMVMEDERDFGEDTFRDRRDFGEDTFRDRRDFTEDTRRYDQDFGEGARRFDTTEGRMRANDQFSAEVEGSRLAMDQGKQRMSAEDMALGAAQSDRGAMLNEAQFAAETLRSPSDWFARAYASRGATAPGGRITQADLLNALGMDVQGARMSADQAVANARRFASQSAGGAIPQYRAPAPIAPAGGRMAAPTTPVAAPAPNPYDAINAIAAAQNAAGANLSQFNTGANAAPGVAPLDTPRMEHGGKTHENMVMTGDSSDGKENEELVIDLPNDGGLMVIPKDRLVGKRKRRMAEAAPKAQDGGTFTTQPQAGWDAPGNQVVTSIDQQGRGTYSPYQTGMSMDASGVFAFRGGPSQGAGAVTPSAPRGVFGASQEELVNTARMTAPPAIQAVAAGQRVPHFRQALPNLSLGRVNRMTGSERQALDSYLGLTENTTLQDELDGMRQTFGPQVSRPRARLVG